MTECVLGCGTYRVVLTARCGDRIVCDISQNITTLQWGRVMDDTSQAVATVGLNGVNGEACCGCLGSIRSWIHSMVIYRDGELVWGPGPVTNVLYRRDTIVVTAHDISAWLDKRVTHGTYDDIGANLQDEIEKLLFDALSPDDPCGLFGRVIVNESSTLIDKVTNTASGYAGDVLRDFAKNYVDYTVVGDQLLIGENLNFGPYTTLHDEDFQVDLEIEERGSEAGTKWYVAGNASTVPVLGSCGGIDPYYGLLEQIASDNSVKTVRDANRSACGHLAASNPVPLYINIPQGAQLSPKAPVCFEMLVPGALFDLSLTSYCRPVQTRLRLTSLSVTTGPDEAVQVSLSPVAPITGEIVSRGSLAS